MKQLTFFLVLLMVSTVAITQYGAGPGTTPPTPVDDLENARKNLNTCLKDIIKLDPSNKPAFFVERVEQAREFLKDFGKNIPNVFHTTDQAFPGAIDNALFQLPNPKLRQVLQNAKLEAVLSQFPDLDIAVDDGNVADATTRAKKISDDFYDFIIQFTSPNKAIEAEVKKTLNPTPPSNSGNNNSSNIPDGFFANHKLAGASCFAGGIAITSVAAFVALKYGLFDSLLPEKNQPLEEAA